MNFATRAQRLRAVSISFALVGIAAPGFACPPGSIDPSDAQPPPALSSPGAPPGGDLLREIGRARAVTTFCRAALDHAERAAEGLIAGEQHVAALAHTLHTADFDATILTKTNAVRLLVEANAKLAESAEDAGRSARKLRDDAKTSDTPEEGKNLLAFANALDGALHRQSTLARDMASLISYLNARDPESDLYAAQMGATEFYHGTGGSSRDAFASPFLTSVARKAATDLVERQTGIAADESTAASLLAPSFATCSE